MSPMSLLGPLGPTRGAQEGPKATTAKAQQRHKRAWRGRHSWWLFLALFIGHRPPPPEASLPPPETRDTCH
eukprot:5367116-Pyramimonas_sp.AAC.1